MCFHNSMSKKARELAARYGRKSDVVEIVQDIINEQYHINAFSFPWCPIVTRSEELQVFNWGLIPHWIKSASDAQQIRTMTLNARADTLFIKPSFRESINKRRCLVPSTGYFEWRHEKNKKQPYCIFVKEEAVFSMAGIYDTWIDPITGEQQTTFSIITTEANPLASYIHNTKMRMPAILAPQDEEGWLHPGLTKTEIEQLLIPFDAELMDAYKINNDFLHKSSTDRSILKAI